MGIAGRLFRLAKAYFTAASDKIDRVAREVEAEAELKEARKATEAVRRAREELDDAPPLSAPTPVRRSALPLAAEYKLLGVPYGSDLSVAEDAWRRLAQRADPKRFRAGTSEERRAAEILSMINSAYARIREAKSPTEGRFGKLEL